MLSHPHEDHVAGLALLLDRYRVGRVLEPGMRGPGPGYAAWLDRLSRPGAPPRLSIGAGDRLTVDEIAMRVLWPIRGQVPLEPPDTGTGINNVSVVLLGVIGQRRFLLAGDVEQDVDPSLLSEGLPHVDLLKVAHHGSRTATTDAFLAAVRPRIAVASAGTGNPYGHPAPRTLERLAATGARVYRTDVDGSVAVTFEADGPVVRTHPRRGATVPAPTAAAAVAPIDGPGRTFLCAIPVSRSETATAADLPARATRPPATAEDQARPSPTAGDPVIDGYAADRKVGLAHGGRGPGLLPRSADVIRRARRRRDRARGFARGGQAGDRVGRRRISARAVGGTIGPVGPRLRSPPGAIASDRPPLWRPLDGRASFLCHARPSPRAHSGSVVSAVCCTYRPLVLCHARPSALRVHLGPTRQGPTQSRLPSGR